MLVGSAGFGFYWVFNFITKRIISNRKRQELPFKLDGRPVLLYFTTPDCVPCRTIQIPAIEKLKNFLGKDTIQVVKIDASQEPELASQWKVLSVPTTFIVDKNGEVKHINHGVADFHKLKKQFSAII